MTQQTSGQPLPKLPVDGDLIGGRFRIIERIGAGGFGTVYRAVQENVGREVALKFLSPKIARDPVNIERFRREAFHISQLRHPNTITLYDYGQTESGLFYMVMELLEGISLSDDIQQHGAVEVPRAAHIYLQILKSLCEAHKSGLVHRDLKPENIHLCEMFGEQDYVKVLDFGVAKMTMFEEGADEEEKLTKAGRIFGTPMYMSPEQACAEPITTATDIYALGLLLFEMLTGLPPVTGRNRMDVIQKQIRDEVPRLTKKLRGTPLGEVIRKATQKAPADRYVDATQLLDAFMLALRQEGIAPAPRGATHPSIAAFALIPEVTPPEQHAAPRPPAPPAQVIAPGARAGERPGPMIQSLETFARNEPPQADDASTVARPRAVSQLASALKAEADERQEATVVTSLPERPAARVQGPPIASPAVTPPAPAMREDATVVESVPIHLIEQAARGESPGAAPSSPSDEATQVTSLPPDPRPRQPEPPANPQRISGPPPEPTQITAPPEPLNLPFIGREQETSRALDALSQMRDQRRGKLLLIEGERGVGKTRLIHELQGALASEGVPSGLGTFRRRGLALDALREVLASLWHVQALDQQQLASALRQRLVGTLASEDVTFLIDFLRPHAGAADRTSLASTEETNSLYARLERILLALVQVQPLVLILEDFQEADSATLSFLEYIAVTLRAQPAPLGIALSWGTGGRPLTGPQEQSLRTITSAFGQDFSRLKVRRLRDRQLSVLIDAILPLEARLKDRIAWLSQGNPMHAIQIVRYLQTENNLIPDARGRWGLRTGSPRQIELPPDLVHLMQWRVRQAVEGHPHHAGLEATVYWLAVMGMRVPLELIGRALGQHARLSFEQVHHNLDVLRRFELVTQTTHQDLLCVEFENSLLREALIRDLEPDHLRAMHRACAEHKERFFAERRLEPPALEIAEHWRMAGDPDRYRDALFTAAQRSMRQHDPRGAREQFEELLRLLDEHGERGTMWASVQLALAELARRFGEFGLAEDHYKKAVESGVLDGEELAQAERGLAHLLFVMARYAQAVRHYRNALNTSTNAQNKAGVAKALIGLSRVHLRQGDPGAGQKVRTRLENTLRELQSSELSGKVLLHLAEAELRQGNMAQRHDYLLRALEDFKRTSDLQGTSDALLELGSVLMVPAEGTPARLEEASRVLREALEIKRSIGDRHGVAEIFRNLGHLSVEFNDFEAAEHYYLQALRMHEALGAVYHIGAVYNAVGIVRMMMGDTKGSEQSFVRAQKLFERVGDRIAASHVLLNRGTLALNELELERAEELLREARDIKDTLDSTWGLYDVYNHLAIVLMWRGKREEAEALLSATLEGLSDAAADEDKAVARSLTGLLAAFNSRLQLAALELGRARGDAEDLDQKRILALCQANAAFFAALTGDEGMTRRLLDALKEAPLLNTLHRKVWLHLITALARQSAEAEPSRQSARQLRAVLTLADGLNERDPEFDAIRALADRLEAS